MASTSSSKIYQDKDWLVQKYWIEELSTVEMAEIAGVWRKTIVRHMKRHGIPRRAPKNLTGRARKKISTKLSAIMRGRPKSEKWKQSASKSRIGNTPSADVRKKISNALKGRDLSEEHKRRLSEGRMGENNPFYGCHHTSETIRSIIATQWKGGATKYYGPNWRHQKKKAVKRDKYICQICGALSGFNGRAHDVHHRISLRDFYEDICNMYEFLDGFNQFIVNAIGHHNLMPDMIWDESNRLDNLVTLCTTCHHKVEHGTIEL